MRLVVRITVLQSFEKDVREDVNAAKVQCIICKTDLLGDVLRNGNRAVEEVSHLVEVLLAQPSVQQVVC
jgi:hypothetical protein